MARSPASDEARIIPSFAGVPAMNGIDPSQYADFWKDWHWVTSRYRKDNNETRIVFANDIAWHAMESRLGTYPDGAMFAKALFNSEDDPVFPASKVPKGYTEVEFIKKDKAAYASTAGWGYAIFYFDPLKSDHHSLGLNAKLAEQVGRNCFSCHSIAKSRDYVFALPAFLQWHLSDASADQALFRNQFVETVPSDLPGTAQKIINHFKCGDCRKIKYYPMPYFYIGQNMAVASVAQFTLDENLPHLVFSHYLKTFIFTYPVTDSKSKASCVGYAMTTASRPEFVESGKICDSKLFTEKFGKRWF
jgi:hypothetical protein